MWQVQAEGKNEDWLPAWYVHLPSGEKVGIKHISRRGSLIRFTTRDERSYVVLAPTAVAVTIKPFPEDSEGFPIEFLGEDGLPENEGESG